MKLSAFILFVLLVSACTAQPDTPNLGSNDSLHANDTGAVTGSVPVVMRLTSPSFSNNGVMPAKFTCDGAGVSPALEISGAPEGTASFVLIVDDPDSLGAVFLHWILWNIPASTTFIAEGGVPVGAVQGLNDFGFEGYGGPCPPSGTHHYRFTLYALDVNLSLGAGSFRSEVESAMAGHVLSEAELVGLYSSS